MDSMVYAALTGYFKALGKTGYYKYEDVFSLLVLCFYRDYVFNDYRGIISRNDYREIENALNCLFGANCLIPYPDYLKMGKLHLGEMTEVAQRVKTLEETKVLKAMNADGSSDSDIIIVGDEEE